MSGDVDGKASSGNLGKSKDENQEEQKICEKWVPNRTGRFAKYFVQLQPTKER